MAPFVTLAVIALAGLVGWGLEGLIGGIFLGYAFAFLFGSIGIAISGGLLPRKVRRQVAENFLSSNASLVRAAYPELPERKLRTRVEKSIERIFRRASVANRSPDASAGFSLTNVRTGASELISAETDDLKKKFLQELELQIERDGYSE